MDSILEAWGFRERVEVNDPIGTGSQGCAYTDFAEAHGFIKEHRRYINRWIDEMRSGNPTPWAQDPSPAPPMKDIDSFIGASGVDWLSNYNSEKPFYLQVQFTGPHDPYDGPYEFRRLYDEIDIGTGIANIPKNPPSSLKRRLHNRSNIVRATPTQRTQWRVNYYANITLIDHWIGELISTLESKDLAENTWIVFTSDHGEMLGDLGLMGKTVFFEPSIHVPLLIHMPHQATRRIDSLVEQVDIPVTLMQVASSDSSHGLLGMSLLPYLQGDSPSRTKPCVYSELFGETTVVTDRYKFTLTADTHEATQLLDRFEDPDELQNFVDASQYEQVKLELIEQFLLPLRPRLDQSAMSRYRDYVQSTGRLN